MKILNFGSLNIDNVYTVEEFVHPGETVTAKSHTVFAGGKGLNQSIAAARAGAEVIHGGSIGPDGGFRGGQPRPPAGRGGGRRLCDGSLR